MGGDYPLPGFVDAVMDAVRREAAIPPPLEFPWKRALPLFTAAVLALGCLVVGLATQGAGAQPTAALLPSDLALILAAAKTAGVGWILLALAISFASLRLSALLVSWRAWL